MREFVFTVEYERGADEVMDLFIENPDLHSKTMAIHATSESMWRLDRLTGPTEALEAFDEVIEQATRCNGVLGMCGAPVVEWEYEVLSETPNGRIVYSCREEGDGIQSIPHVAAKHIGDGLLMQAERRGAQNQWRLLISDDDTVSEIYEEVKDSLSDGLSLSVQRISEPECWLEESVSADGLPPEQQAALEAAVEFGYYETPRQHTVQEISEELDIPNSTLQYRLTRAEAWLARQFVTGTLGTEVEDRVDPEKLEASA
ncbi:MULTISPECIES: helix-turn-helix domain-containing protein [Haloferax]|jgi:predicted DNA binding protein|uniref:Transcriptional regulator n=3 Tax=Haloferax volcanii TaxID=2246 RepID=A0A6C0UYC4_HALVO|nr:MULTISPECIES: helix-turn-helix domain-containing protein [Haloferax]ELK47733.1 transcription regulator [Haloferax sp. BAB-2207]ELZ77585.1 transcription regulator [Haloferax lucentense DSM 14919]ELZ95709.1 transcription regulator [Haloferax alexandrinus JCM 10717]MBC9988136.1 transcriptional regulator [Haloferax sp. AS1]NLV03133.1 transcriptional regulator [Haloferax alexandrinus]